MPDVTANRICKDEIALGYLFFLLLFTSFNNAELTLLWLEREPSVGETASADLAKLKLRQR